MENTVVRQMIDEATADKGKRFANIGFSTRTLGDGTKIGCQVRNAYTGQTDKLTTRTEWLVNGHRRSVKVVTGLLDKEPKPTARVYNEIYIVNSAFAPAVELAITKLAAEHPEWGLDMSVGAGNWERCED